MKIKVFSYNISLPVKIEEQVNEFIKDKKVIDIKQSESVEDGVWSFAVTVIYEELRLHESS